MEANAHLRLQAAAIRAAGISGRVIKRNKRYLNFRYMKKIFPMHTPLCCDDNKTLHMSVLAQTLAARLSASKHIYKRKRWKRTGFARGGPITPVSFAGIIVS